MSTYKKETTKKKTAIQTNIKSNQHLTVLVKRLGINGEGIAYYKNLVLFIPGALPKEKVVVKLHHVKQKFAQATLLKILKKSPERIKPPCSIYDVCGACQLQHLTYQGQLNFKRDLLKQALHKFKPEGYLHYDLKPTIGMQTPFYYRNKAQYQVRLINGKPTAGLYKENSHQLVSLTNCIVQMPPTQDIINFTLHLIKKRNLSIYNERTQKGLLKTLMVRTAKHTGETQLVFITKAKQVPYLTELLLPLQQKFPQLVSIMQNVQPKNSSLIFGEQTYHLAGKKAIVDHIEEVSFDLSPRAFFQLNPTQTVLLYKEAKKALHLKKEETLVDAYCGVGTIGLSMAKEAKEVRGMDTIEEAIFDAKQNALKMNLTNTHYEVGKAETLLPKWFKEGFIPDAILVDPPRTGLDDQLKRSLIDHPVSKLVYISCNVSTLAKDLVSLAKVYTIHYLQSVDMFPQTARCEVVVKLTKKTYLS